MLTRFERKTETIVVNIIKDDEEMLNEYRTKKSQRIGIGILGDRSTRNMFLNTPISNDADDDTPDKESVDEERILFIKKQKMEMQKRMKENERQYKLYLVNIQKRRRHELVLKQQNFKKVIARKVRLLKLSSTIVLVLTCIGVPAITHISPHLINTLISHIVSTRSLPLINAMIELFGLLCGKMSSSIRVLQQNVSQNIREIMMNEKEKMDIER